MVSEWVLTTMALFGSSKTMEKDLNLVVLTSDILFQHIEASLYLLHLLTLQLKNRPTIKADPFVYIEDLALLFVDGNMDIFLHVTDGLRPLGGQGQTVERVLGRRETAG